ncbi:MAG TPA: efflux RND transporter periplasmic adaptor subunit [Alphaproteobacteria bacterium]|nr:efflux RND transporter periplasmic adaptor subunit [Alphaproteobacteria bacterium]
MRRAWLILALMLPTAAAAQATAAGSEMPEIGLGAAPEAMVPSAQPLARQVRAQVTPRRSATIASGMSGRIVDLPFKDGERFRQGQLLAQFDCSLPRVQLERSRAQLDKRQRVLEVNTRLNKLGSLSGVDLALSEAEVAEGRAEVKAAAVLVERCAIAAPFAGRVSGIAAQEHQFIGEGQPLLEIVEDGELEAEMIVPSRWLTWLKPGHRFDIAIEETGQRYPTEIVRIAGRVDPVSQSVKVYGRIVGAAPGLLVGMSGEALLAPPEPRS